MITETQTNQYTQNLSSLSFIELLLLSSHFENSIKVQNAVFKKEKDPMGKQVERNILDNLLSKKIRIVQRINREIETIDFNS